MKAQAFANRHLREHVKYGERLNVLMCQHFSSKYHIMNSSVSRNSVITQGQQSPETCEELGTSRIDPMARSLLQE